MRNRKVLGTNWIGINQSFGKVYIIVKVSIRGNWFTSRSNLLSLLAKTEAFILMDRNWIAVLKHFKGYEIKVPQ